MTSGDRVVLRGIERRDLPALWEQVNDLEVEQRASDQRPVSTSLAELEARFDARAAEPESDRIRFVVEVDTEVIGECMLWGIDYSRLARLGVALRRERWGQGFGQDAVRTARA